MGFLDLFKKKTVPSVEIDFKEIDSNEKAAESAKNGFLAPLYLMPLRFGGLERLDNMLYVPPFVVELKNRCDDKVQELLEKGQVNGYECSPEYKEKSFIPAKITVIAKKDGEPVLTETINIW